MADTVLVRNLHPGRKKVFFSQGSIPFGADKRIPRRDLEVLVRNGFVVEIPDPEVRRSTGRTRPRRQIEVPLDEGD